MSSFDQCAVPGCTRDREPDCTYCAPCLQQPFGEAPVTDPSLNELEDDATEPETLRPEQAAALKTVRELVRPSLAPTCGPGPLPEDEHLRCRLCNAIASSTNPLVPATRGTTRHGNAAAGGFICGAGCRDLSNVYRNDSMGAFLSDMEKLARSHPADAAEVTLTWKLRAKDAEETLRTLQRKAPADVQESVVQSLHRQIDQQRNVIRDLLDVVKGRSP